MKSRKHWFYVSIVFFLGMVLFPHSSHAADVIWPNWDSDVTTGWDEIKNPSTQDIRSRLYDPNKRVSIGPDQVKATVATVFHPGGYKAGITDPDEEDFLLRRRFDVPFVEFYPKPIGLSLNTTYKRVNLGRDVDVSQQGAVRPNWNLNLKSLGLVFAVEDDVSTIQEASTGRITDYELSPEEPTIDVATLKIFKKLVSRVDVVNGYEMEALKYRYEVSLKDKQGESYRVQVDNTYYPSKDGRVRISFDIKNIGKKTIPHLMVGYNYTPEVKFINYKINNEPDGIGVSGQVKYLGKNLGIYAVDSEGLYRAEIYPSLDKYGADNWTAWAQPFQGKYGMGNRDSSVFMKGFDDPNDLYSKGQENKGIAKNTLIEDEPLKNKEGGSDATISMKWNPQDLAVGEVRNTAWIYGSEIKDIYPLINVTEDDRKYSVAKDGNSNAVIKGTWRIYETLKGTIKYTIDDGAEQTVNLKYDTDDDIGGIERFEIPLTFKPTANHTIKMYIEDDAGHKSEEKTEVYSFEYPEPEITGTSSIKVNNKATSKVMIGGEFVYNMDLTMQTPYSRLFGNKVSIPINTAVINPTSLKNISISNGKKVVNGAFNSTKKTLDFTFEDNVTADDSLQVQFTGKIIDSESLIGQSFDIIPSEVTGKSGISTNFKEFSMPVGKLPKATATIMSKVSKINVKYLIEDTDEQLGDEAPKEGLTGSKDALSSKPFTGYLLSKIVVDGIEQKPLTDPVSVEYGTTNEVIFYYQTKPVLTADLAISLPEISEGEKVIYTSTFKNTSAKPSDLSDVTYETIEAFPENVEVNLESLRLNDQPLEKGAAKVDTTRKLSVDLGKLEPKTDYTLTYEVVSKIATPVLTKPLEVKQAYMIKGKSVNGTIVKGDSGELKSFTIKPRLADITVLHLEEETDANLGDEDRQGIIGEEITVKAKEIKGFVLTKVTIDHVEQPLSSTVKVKYGENYIVEFYYKGVLEFSSVPSTMSFGTKAMDGNEIRVNKPSYDAPLVVSDSRSDKKSWTLKAKMTTPLTNDNGRIIVGAIRYKSPGKEEFPLNDGAQPLLTTSNAATYDVSATWGDLKDSPGFKFELPAVKVKELGKYKGTIEYSLEDTYKP